MINSWRDSIFKANYILPATVILFTVIPLLFSFPVSEGDYYWHVRTGQWIWEHKSLPSHDPFSHIGGFLDPSEHVAERTRFILRQYWLGQLALFGIWKVSGEAGMVVFRSLAYTGILGFIYWSLRPGKNGIVPLVTVFIAGNVLRNYSGERPQIFAFMFAVAMLYLLEQIIARAGTRKRHVLPLLVTMIVWSNCHGSFILGVIIVFIYALCHMVSARRNSTGLDYRLLTVFCLAIMVTAINPNGYKAFNSLLDMNVSYRESIAEYISPVTELFVQHIPDYYYWVLISAVAFLIFFRARFMALHHIVVIVSLAALSLSGLRYIPFFVVAVPLVFTYMPDWKFSSKHGAVILLLVIVWLSKTDFRNTMKLRANKAFPVKAVSFLNLTEPKGNLFNYAYWGGYLMCYTKYPVFVDGRGLDEKFTLIHNQILAGIDWQKTLSFFNIDTIMIPGTSEGNAETYPLLLQLHDDAGWSLVYQDDVALIFQRNTPHNEEFRRRYAIGKERIGSHIVERLKWQLEGTI